MRKPLAVPVLALVVLLAQGPASAGGAGSTRADLARASAVTGPFLEEFSGPPGDHAPAPWKPADWDVTVHSRNADTWAALEPMAADHGGMCAGPPSAHQVTAYEDAVFLCKDHMMTSINATGYGMIYLTPNQQVDFSGGEAVIRFDASTLRTSGRDWWDIWITPFADNLQLALDGFPDAGGPPNRAIHVFMEGADNRFAADVYRGFQPLRLPRAGNVYDEWLTPDPARRDTFELRIGNGRLKFGMPSYNRWWIDAALPPDLGFSRGVVQLGHHSYTPDKDCDPGSPCRPNTWHWDKFSIDRAVPFTIIRADRRSVAAATGTTVRFPSPAPEGAYLRFAGIASNLWVSADGRPWVTATSQRQAGPTPVGHFSSYWVPIPKGTQQVTFAGTDPPFSAQWHVRDISIWSEQPPTSVPPGPTPPGPTPPGPTPPGVPGPNPPGFSGEFAALNPARLLDTRPGGVTVDGTFAGPTPGTGASSTIELTVAGRGGVPAGATGVVMNVTATGASGGGYLTVYPCGAPFPLASNVNFSPGRDVANAVVTQLGAGGTVCIYSGASGTDVVADVTGYFAATSSYSAVNPARLLDTRQGAMTSDGQLGGAGAAGGSSTIELPVAGRGGVPANAGSVILNLTAAGARGDGYLTVYPCGTTRPLASNVNFSPGRDVANAVLTKLGAGGAVCIYNGAGTADVVADVSGWFPANSGFAADVPARLLDTRSGALTADGEFSGLGSASPNTVIELQVTGRPSVPVDASAVVLNVTATGAQGDGFLTVYPCGQPFPLASSLNYGHGRDVANVVVTQVGDGGRVCIFAGAAATHVVADVNGYFTATGASGYVGSAPGGSRAPSPTFVCMI